MIRNKILNIFLSYAVGSAEGELISLHSSRCPHHAFSPRLDNALLSHGAVTENNRKEGESKEKKGKGNIEFSTGEPSVSNKECRTSKGRPLNLFRLKAPDLRY